MEKELPGYNMELVKKRIRELQEKYEKEIKPREKDYNEENTKKGFIQPILNVLNWNTEDINEVDAEFYVKNKRSSGSADYALKINGEVKILLEAKSFDKDLETGFDIVHGMRRTYVEQLINYAFDLNKHMNTKIDYCILTNGKEWRVYYVHYQGVSFDRKLVFVLKIEEFLDKFLKFWSLEKGNFQKGDLDQFLKDDERLKIDKKAVTSLLYCKKILVDSMIKDYNENKRDMKYVIDKLINKPISDAPETFPKFYEMPEEERLSKFILEATSNIINKILFIRIIEDKGFVRPKLTKQFVREWKETWSTDKLQNIMKLFKDACEQAEGLYNGGLFELNPYDNLPYDNNTIENIMGLLGDFNFEEIDTDVIGRIYEIYLGTVLSVEEEIRGKKRTKLSSDFTERKKLGQYYTPKFVVDYIIKNTLGKLLEGKSPEEVSKIKILDPACGSGSFLIRAFDYLKDYYVGYNDQQMNKIKKNGVGDINNYIKDGKIVDYNHKILKENLHGVDLNYLSTQICSINLWLRALEKDKKLEKLSKNILHGNSLISGIENKEELIKHKAELEKIAELRVKIKDYYGKELGKREKDELEEMESKLKELREKINAPLNENLKKYFENLDVVYPFNWEVELTEVFDPNKSEEEQGFDIVIGNPPYVNVKELGADFKQFTSKFYHMIGRPDLYLFFIEKGINLLKNGGFLAFIVSGKFLVTKNGGLLRKYILDNTKINYIINLSSQRVFDDVSTYPLILVVEKCSDKKIRDNNKIEVMEIKEQLDFEEVIKPNNLIKKTITQKQFYENNDCIFNISTSDKFLGIIKRIKEDTLKLNKICDIRNGIIVGDQKKYIISKDNYSSLDKNKKNSYKKVIGGKNVQRYELNYDNEYVLYDKDKIVAPRDESLILMDKLILKDIALRMGTYLDREQYYPLQTLNFCTLSDTNFDLRYILALLNSTLLDFYYKQHYSEAHVSGDYMRFRERYISDFPIKKISINKQNIVGNKVDKIQMLIVNKNNILNRFNQSLNNQSISDEKACKFEHYWRNSELYDFSKETMDFANKTEAKILDMEIKQEGNKLIVYTTNISEVQNKEFKNIKTIELTIKDDILRKFLYLSFKKYINEKRGSFGSGIILDIIKKIPVPVYMVNVKMNLDKIKQVIKEFEHETKDLWEIEGKTYSDLTEIEEDIEKTDKEIDDMVYDLYNITKEERKIIEESLK